MCDDELIQCPRCGNPECDPDDEYCFNCGMPLHNPCLDPLCPLNDKQSSPIPLDYCFCPVCGNKTTLYESELIEPRKFISD